MNTPFDAGRFAVGQPVSRIEDPVLLRGQGRYTDDLNLPGQAFAVMVRSPFAHGILRGIDTGAARAASGVLGVFTAADLKAAGIKPMQVNVSGQNHDGRPFPRPVQYALAEAKVRYVGDPIAVVVADSRAAARDAAELVMPDIAPLPAVTDAAAAARPGASVVHDEAPGNVVLDWKFGDEAAVEAAFASAAHVVGARMRNNRIVVAALEPRACLAEFAEGRFVLRVVSQGAFGMRNSAANALGVPREQVRVLVGNVGGSFGMKSSLYPEYVCALFAARALGRPVKWTDERTGSFLSDSHGRDHDQHVELALDAEGHFLALRVRGFGNLGAYLSNSTTLPPTMNLVKNIIGTYRTPLIHVAVRCMFTNTTPVGAYRGAGRPEGNYYMQRLIELAAAKTGIDGVELRHRNMIAPAQMPWQAPSTMLYDSGEFSAVLDKALALADWNGFAARRAESAGRGKLRGRGIGQYLEVTAPARAEMGGIRFEPDGTVTIVSGTLDYGQGHATPFAQVLVRELGVPFGKIRLVQGDSDQLLEGGGTGGSRSIMNGGGAIVAASAEVVKKGKALAADILEAAEADIVFEAGKFRIAGTDRAIAVIDLAAELARRGRAGALDVALVFPGVTSAFPNGVHIAEVEVDPDTGTVIVVRYAMVNDFGTVVNPLLVAGQAHGGVVQGIGQALAEHVVFDEAGQPLAGSFMDYAIPRAGDAPDFVWASHPVPAKTNPLGAKGCGEAGCAGALPAVMNALNDALSAAGAGPVEMPASPEVVWRALRAAASEQHPTRWNHPVG
jgi:carbon-monoxide dehydrogenase large subunit